MKKFFTVLGIIFASLILLGIISFAVLNYFGSKLDKESKAYIDEIVPKIVSAWDVEELISRANSELLKVAPEEKIEALFNTFSERLGLLEEYKGSMGQAGIHVTPQGKFTTAEYVAEASFKKADATIRVRTVFVDDKWQIIEFHVNSQALLP